MGEVVPFEARPLIEIEGRVGSYMVIVRPRPGDFPPARHFITALEAVNYARSLKEQFGWELLVSADFDNGRSGVV